MGGKYGYGPLLPLCWESHTIEVDNSIKGGWEINFKGKEDKVSELWRFERGIDEENSFLFYIAVPIK